MLIIGASLFEYIFGEHSIPQKRAPAQSSGRREKEDPEREEGEREGKDPGKKTCKNRNLRRPKPAEIPAKDKRI
jgi:hypothetical protein